ncbi:MAG: DUF11 domain-containing protein, partial [Chloroflexi bacterium]|nr:DUF11 domain-containing protein [Chloroflexota bacterium]
QLSKGDSPDPVVAGGALTYTLVVTNNGPSTANNVSLSDAATSDFVFASAATTQGTCTVAVMVNCALGTLAPNTSAAVVLRSTVNPTTRGAFDNTATVIGLEPELNPADNSATQTTTAIGVVDLGIVKSASSSSVLAGGLLTYTLSITNGGPSAAMPVTVTDTMHVSASIVSINSSQGSCTAGSPTIVCSLGTVMPNTNPIITIVARTSNHFSGNNGVLVNTAFVSSPEPDLDAAKHTSSVTTQVLPSADMRISKSGRPDPVVAGKTLTYTMWVTDVGLIKADGVVVTDNLPAGVTFVSAATELHGTCAPSGGTVVCNLIPMEPNDPVQIQIVVGVNDDTVGVITNSATVSANQPDPD